MDFDLMRRRLVAAREMIGCNRKEFSERIGIPYRTITNYENGSREPGGDYISKVADVCGVSTDYLLGLTETPRVEAPKPKDAADLKMDQIVALLESMNGAGLEKVLAYASDLAFNPAYKK